MANQAATSSGVEQFRERQRATWAAGDYGALSPYIADVGENVVEHAGVEAGMRVLDVACGDGNAALPAARAGARVTGLDLVPGLLEGGRRKAAEAGVDIDWVQGDAESLPFEDASFDRVFSTFGHMFAPRHQRTADEMARVCGEGGRIVTATWTPEGVAGKAFGASAKYMPPPPDFASPPLLWGTEDHVRQLFGSVATGFAFERHATRLEWESVEAFADYFTANFPPLVTARGMLGERFADLKADLVATWSEANEASDGSLRLPQEYLLSVIRM